MANIKLLATFIVNELQEKFNIYGNYKMVESTTFDEIPNCIKGYPNFFGATATKIVDCKEEAYSPNTTSWSGHKYNAANMMGFLISALS